MIDEYSSAYLRQPKRTLAEVLAARQSAGRERDLKPFQTTDRALREAVRP